MKKAIALLFALLGGAAACSSSESTPLSADEVHALTFTREEEKLARDVYMVLESRGPTFSNIRQSEQTHMDAVEALLDRYDLADPAQGKAAGAFQDATLQKLYEELVREGSVSPLAAMQVGAAIEELDIRDIQMAREHVTHADIANTFDNLTRGSRNHLRAFYGQVQAMGGTYEPRYIDARSFRAIVSSPTETGGPAR
ncbi:MAG: DUF2202 domain-containing protein [Polyangiaceae bacterium]